MWFFRQKIGVDYLRQIINIAENLQKELSRGETKHILGVLKSIAKIDYNSIDNLTIETESDELTKEVKRVYVIVLEAIKNISEGSYKKAEVALYNIIALQRLISKGRARVIYKEKGIDYVYVDGKNWPLYREGVIKLEKSHFGETELGESYEEFDEAVKDKKYILIVAVKDNEVIGYVGGEPLEYADGEPGVNDDPAFGKGTGFYIDGIEVLSNYGSKGVAYVLRTMLVRTAGKKGYKTLSSDNRQGFSTRNALRMGGKVFKKIPNYYNTGETYYYIIVDLERYK